MHIREKWITQASEIIQLARPNIPKKKLIGVLENVFDKNFQDHDAELYNNYDEEILSTSLAKVLDWIQIEKPYITESGCFFKNRYKCRNHNAEIMESQLNRRGILKKEMFQAREAGDYVKERFKNSSQNNQKKRANSGYGAELNKYSFLYNTHSAISITASGRSQLSVAGLCFENLFSNNVKFRDMNEFYIYVNNIDKEEYKFDFNDVIDQYVSREDFITVFYNKFDLDVCIPKEEAIGNIYDNMSKEKRNRLFYKSNILYFFMNKKPLNIFKKIMSNNISFNDPNKIPSEFKAELLLLSELVLEYVVYKYQPFRYENKMKFSKKDIIIVSDTDSTFLYFGLLLKQLKTLLPYVLLRKKAYEDYNMKIVNILCSFATTGVTETLSHYMDTLNIEEDMKHHVDMKNEFAFLVVVTTTAKKSYFGSMYRQEGYIYPELTTETKGVNFFKSTSTEMTSDFINKKILRDNIYQPKDGKIDIIRINRLIKEYESSMKTQIDKGDIRYYKTAIKVKHPDSYANPMSTNYKSVYVWNVLCDKDYEIETPSIITQVKVDLKNKSKLSKLASTYPDMYYEIQSLYNDKNLLKKDKNGKEVFIGINSIAIPYGMDIIPEWLLIIQDENTMINDNMKLFAQLYKPLSFKAGTSTFDGKQMKNYTNIIKI